MKKFIKSLFNHAEKPDDKGSTDLILSQYEKIFHWLADVAPEEWNEAKVACKVFEDSNHGTFFFLVGEESKKVVLPLPTKKRRELYEFFKDLKMLSLNRNEPWVGCRFKVNNNGKYDVLYFYKDLDLEEIANA